MVCLGFETRMVGGDESTEFCWPPVYLFLSKAHIEHSYFSEHAAYLERKKYSDFSHLMNWHDCL